MLDLESDAMRGLDSIPTGGNILSLEFFCFHSVKTEMPISAFLCICEKHDCWEGEEGSGHPQNSSG